MDFKGMATACSYCHACIAQLFPSSQSHMAFLLCLRVTPFMEHLCFILMFSTTCVVHEVLLLLCLFVRFLKVFLQLVTIYSVEITVYVTSSGTPSAKTIQLRACRARMQRSEPVTSRTVSCIPASLNLGHLEVEGRVHDR